ncbi:hypothetical protein BGZ63DRAFT_4925 [Mariannaea sp. PMI_226]|nr:hypothetical protein BGZ63DRAFT_4925 [Mariannaea sp. PMI_226]
MLSTVGRAAARRLVTPRLALLTPQLLSPRVHSVACASASVRTFTASSWTRLAESREIFPKTTPKKKKKTTSKKTTTKKAAKHKPKPKPKPKKKAPRPLSPENQEKEELRQLKKWSLLTKLPCLPDGAWSLYVSQELKAGAEDLGTKMRALSTQFKALSSYEREELSRTAQSNRVTNEANYKAWVESYPVENIYVANKARRSLARKTGKVIRPIRDDRLPKPAGGAYSEFIKAKFHTLDSEIPLPKKIKELSAQWKTLSDAEKQSYQDIQHDERAEYSAEMAKLKTAARKVQSALKAEEAALKKQRLEARAASRARSKAKAAANAETTAEKPAGDA